jgi:hypothetical protein
LEILIRRFQVLASHVRRIQATYKNVVKFVENERKLLQEKAMVGLSQMGLKCTRVFKGWRKSGRSLQDELR